MPIRSRVLRIAVALAQNKSSLFVSKPARLFRLAEPDHPGEQPDETDGGANQKRGAPADRADERGQDQPADRRSEIGAAVEDGRKQRALLQRNPFADDTA